MDVLRQHIAHAEAGTDCDACAATGPSGQIGRRTETGAFGLAGDVVHEVVHLQNVAAGENTLDPRLAGFVYQSTVRDGVDGNAGGTRQLVLRNETDGQKQRVTGNIALCLGNRTALRVYLRDGHALYALFAVNLTNGCREIKRNVKIFETLHNIAR